MYQSINHSASIYRDQGVFVNGFVREHSERGGPLIAKRYAKGSRKSVGAETLELMKHF